MTKILSLTEWDNLKEQYRSSILGLGASFEKNIHSGEFVHRVNNMSGLLWSDLDFLNTEYGKCENGVLSDKFFEWQKKFLDRLNSNCMELGRLYS